MYIIRHQDYGSIRLGQYEKNDMAAGVTNELKTIAAVFSQAGIPIHLAEKKGYEEIKDSGVRISWTLSIE
ncbi:MAG: hypothetical protein PF482_04845 [Desulfobacteraceae bacterium]|jgi:hypothetical protein|nr:hypothetical protein [Desulfobacteraceae bacterium]